MSRALRTAIVVVLSAASFSHVFRLPGDAILTTGLGDWVDPYFINYLLEHWYQSLRTGADPSSPPMFFPVRGTLGYSHGLVLFAPFYAVVRPFLDPFQAYNVALFLILQTGSVCLFILLDRFLGLDFFEALLLTAFFVTSENVVNGGTGVWSQRASVFLIPPIILIGAASATVRSERMKLGLAAITGLLACLLLTQDFYSGLFTLLIVVLSLAGFVLLAWRPIALLLRELEQAVALVEREGRHTLPAPPGRWVSMIAIAAFALGLAIAIHPIDRTTIASLRFSATDPSRLFAIALVAGGWYVISHLRRLDRALSSERAALSAFPRVGPLSAVWVANRRYLAAFASAGLAGLLMFAWTYACAYREHPSFPQDQLANSLRTTFAAAYEGPRSFRLVLLAGILLWLPGLGASGPLRAGWLWAVLISALVIAMPMRFGDFSLWRTLFAPLPGFSVIRDPSRIVPLYELALVFAAALMFRRLPRRGAIRLAFAGLISVLLATDWNSQAFDYGRSRQDFAHWIDMPIAVEPSCRSFFIKGASAQYMSRSAHMWALYNVDAMFIALKRSIPTLNGYSAWTPTGWSLANPQEPDYEFRVREWIDEHQLLNVCELDIERRTMTQPKNW